MRHFWGVSLNCSRTSMLFLRTMKTEEEEDKKDGGGGVCSMLYLLQFNKTTREGRETAAHEMGKEGEGWGGGAEGERNVLTTDSHVK